MKTSTILPIALLGALATAARALDFADTLGSPATTGIHNYTSLVDGESDNEEERIYGGTEANAALYKYIVSIRKTADGMTYCGGSLIAPQYVLTAAHCVKKEGTMYASIGSKYASGTADGERFAVTEAFVHPKYDKPNHLYDVAILKLAGKSSVTPVPLAAADGSDNKETMMAVVRGWGLTETKVQASTLQEVNVRIITNAECNKQYNNRITDLMLCAGEGGGKDSCQGDSGGPLVSNNKLVGVVSWGGECGDAAGVYARVTSVLDFINEKISGAGGPATNGTATPAPATTPAATPVPATTPAATPAPAATTVTPAATTAAPEASVSPAPVTPAPVTPTLAPATPAPATPEPATKAPTPTEPATLAPKPTEPATLTPEPTEPMATITPKAMTDAPITSDETPAPAATPSPAATTMKPAAGKVICMVKPKKPAAGGIGKDKDASKGKTGTIDDSPAAATSPKNNNDIKQSDAYTTTLSTDDSNNAYDDSE